MKASNTSVCIFLAYVVISLMVEIFDSTSCRFSLACCEGFDLLSNLESTVPLSENWTLLLALRLPPSLLKADCGIDHGVGLLSDARGSISSMEGEACMEESGELMSSTVLS